MALQVAAGALMALQVAAGALMALRKREIVIGEGMPARWSIA
jgi:hypothetical protein